MTIMATMRGIPQLYYGSEIGMAGDKGKGDADIRQDFPGGWKDDTNNAFMANGRTAEQSKYFDFSKKVLNKFRCKKSLRLVHSFWQLVGRDLLQVFNVAKTFGQLD